MNTEHQSAEIIRSFNKASENPLKLRILEKNV